MSTMFPWSAKHGMSQLFLALLLLLTQHGGVILAQMSPSDPTDQYGYAKVTPSMAIIIVVLIAALFFMGFFSIYIRHCAGGTSGSGSVRPAGATAGRGSRRAAARGLDASVIETFPMMQYSEVKGHQIGKGALECAVCLNEFEDHETLRLIPKCDHVFHPECIDAWLASHVTCPVCRAILTPQSGDNNANSSSAAMEELAESTHRETDLEAQNEAGVEEEEEVENCDEQAQQPQVVSVEQTLNRNRTRGSRSGSTRGRWFPRSHSTGHSLVQPGENTDRFTLRLPYEVRKQIMNRQLERSMSLVVLPRERSSRRGYRASGINEGSSRGKHYARLEKLDEPATKSDRWVFARNPSFLARASSFLTRASSSIIRSGSVRSNKVVANDGEGTSARTAAPDVNEQNRPPV